jgi:hypothetical protein
VCFIKSSLESEAGGQIFRSGRRLEDVNPVSFPPHPLQALTPCAETRREAVKMVDVDAMEIKKSKDDMVNVPKAKVRSLDHPLVAHPPAVCPPAACGKKKDVFCFW